MDNSGHGRELCGIASDVIHVVYSCVLHGVQLKAAYFFQNQEVVSKKSFVMPLKSTSSTNCLLLISAFLSLLVSISAVSVSDRFVTDKSSTCS